MLVRLRAHRQKTQARPKTERPYPELEKLEPKDQTRKSKDVSWSGFGV